MKDKIITESIKGLRADGLKFSIDAVAEKLKISKKKIYKYFPDKEALAYAVYEEYYNNLIERIKIITHSHAKSNSQKAEELLLCYCDSAGMIRKEIFNKYSLNNAMNDCALRHHAAVWNLVEPYICTNMTSDEAFIYKLIIDGTAQQIFKHKADLTSAVKMLCEIMRKYI